MMILMIINDDDVDANDDADRNAVAIGDDVYADGGDVGDTE